MIVTRTVVLVTAAAAAATAAATTFTAAAGFLDGLRHLLTELHGFTTGCTDESGEVEGKFDSKVGERVQRQHNNGTGFIDASKAGDQEHDCVPEKRPE
ncbi:MAG: hypothetical protein KIT69_16995, partial [Propionibacteriaceae bacterium]|nr:hypothetical protein [Propionibacteriaceae bacterium]